VQRVLLGVLLVGEGVSVEQSASRQDGRLLQAQGPDQVLSPDAEVLILNGAFLILLEAVGDIASLQADGQSHHRLLTLPCFGFEVSHLTWILPRLAGLCVAGLLQLDLPLALEAPHRRDAPLELELHATSAHVVADRPVPDVHLLLVFLLALQLVLHLGGQVEAGVVE